MGVRVHKAHWLMVTRLECVTSWGALAAWSTTAKVLLTGEPLLFTLLARPIGRDTSSSTDSGGMISRFQVARTSYYSSSKREAVETMQPRLTQSLQGLKGRTLAV